jgi:predicted nucleic acid-binding protein
VTVVYDAGVLIAADRSERQVWADHRARLEAGVAPVTTSPVVAQVSRSGRQAQLRRFLRGCEVAPFAADEAHQVGALAGKSKSSDVVDVHVVAIAHRLGRQVLTSDQHDLNRIAHAVPGGVKVLPI